MTTTLAFYSSIKTRVFLIPNKGDNKGVNPSLHPSMGVSRNFSKAGWQIVFNGKKVQGILSPKYLQQRQ
jgi:hypothetical protein